MKFRYFLGISALVALTLLLPFFFPVPLIGHLSEAVNRHILWEIRLPVILTALFAGGVLAGGGLSFQALFRNPLATPYTLGISSGAAFGAVVFIVFIHSGGGAAVPAFAFAGALCSALLVMSFAFRKRMVSAETILLAGVAVNFFFASIIMFSQYIAAQYEVFQITRWLLGGIGNAGFLSVLLTGLAFFGLLAALLLLSPGLDLSALGDDLAASRGLDVRRFKLVVITLVSAAVAATIAFTGPIGFVGIIVPHMVRLKLRTAVHRRLVPMVMAAGGLMLAICDTIGRTVLFPVTVPTGVVTALIGAPFFLWLLSRSRR
ncbi:MAG: iron ABC transporter permease [Acidobacteria bacterium]|nr:iron ABC transporter permease [Acidobacteriota bacterium]